MRLKCPAVNVHVILRGMRRRLSVQAEAVGKNNVYKVTQLFIEGTFAGVFRNIHFGKFLKGGKMEWLAP